MQSGTDLWVFLARSVFLILLFLLQFFLYRKTARWVRSAFPENRYLLPAVRATFFLFNAGTLLTLLQPFAPEEIPAWFLYGGIYPYLIWQSATLFIGLVLVAGSVLRLPFRALWWSVRKIWKEPALRLQESARVRSFDSSRRMFLRRGMYGLTAASFGGSMYGMAFEKFSCDITGAEFVIENLHPDLDGFTVGLVSDVHSSLFMGAREMRQYVEALNGLGTDLVVVAGDFVNSQVREAYPFAEAFSRLSAPHGVYGVMGNHDYYTGDPETVAKIVEDCGIRLLRDSSLTIARGNGRMILAGIEDVGNASAARARMDTAVGTQKRTLPIVLLSHRPYFLPQASAARIDLMLSGHTHGGQIVLGRLGSSTVAPASLASRYIWGPYREGATQMYVSRGIGTVGLPVRLNCPPELTRITLRSGTANTAA